MDQPLPRAPEEQEPEAHVDTNFHRFIGIALGGGRGKNTAVARLEPSGENGQLVVAEARTREAERGGGELVGQSPGAPFRDGPLVKWLETWVDDKTLVAIDAPLTMPACVRCELDCPGVDNCEVPVVKWMREWAPKLVVRRGRSDPGKPAVTPYTQRASEFVMEHLTLQPREALGQGMGPLAARANYLKRRMSPRLELHRNLIEVHPRATLLRGFGAQRERASRVGAQQDTLEARKSILMDLSAGLRFDRVWPDLVVRRVQVFHATVSAFTALSCASEGWRGPADLLHEGTTPALQDALRALGELWREDGWIFVPPT